MNQTHLQQSLTAIVRQVVALARPQRILLFGSAAKGRWRSDSDLDFLIVVDDSQQPDSVLDLLNTRVRRDQVPCDFLVTTASTLRRQRRNPGLVYGAILRESRVVYPRLERATRAERKNWKLLGSGVVIQWPDLDEFIEVNHLVHGCKSAELKDPVPA